MGNTAYTLYLWSFFTALQGRQMRAEKLHFPSGQKYLLDYGKVHKQELRYYNNNNNIS